MAAHNSDKTVTKEYVPLERYEFHAVEDSKVEAGRFSGVASVFGSLVDTFPNRTRFRKGAFLKSINDRGNRIKILSQHDQGSIWIGLPTKMQETDDGLFMEASLNNTQLGRDAADAIRHAVALGKLDAVELSIGFDPLNFEMVEDEELGGEIVREITEARLWEVSLVNFGADRQTKLFEAAQREFKADTQLAFFLEQFFSKLDKNLTPDEIHAGRKISSKNLKRLKEARTALDELIQLAEPQDEDDAADNGTPDKFALDALEAEIAAIDAEFLEIQHGVLQQ